MIWWIIDCSKTWYYKLRLVSGNWTVMLLSMFISFLLAKKFRWRTYLILIAVVVALVSLFSVTVVCLFPLSRLFDPYRPLPLSFPFHVRIYMPLTFIGTSYIYEVYFLTLKIGSIGIGYWTRLPNMDYFLDFLGKVYLLFLIINLVGAILGYWISKTTFIDKLLKKDKSNHVVWIQISSKMK